MQKLCYALLLLKAATALQLALPGLRGAAPGTMRSVRVVAEEEEMDMSDVGLDMLLETMDAAEEAAGPCWMVELKHMSDAGCSAVQKVLKQAQKQGNWLRGLEGTVLVESEDTLQILAQGAPDKLDSFADWCKSELEGADVVVNSVDKEKAGAAGWQKWHGWSAARPLACTAALCTGRARRLGAGPCDGCRREGQTEAAPSVVHRPERVPSPPAGRVLQPAAAHQELWAGGPPRGAGAWRRPSQSARGPASSAQGCPGGSGNASPGGEIRLPPLSPDRRALARRSRRGRISAPPGWQEEPRPLPKWATLRRRLRGCRCEL